MHIREMHAWVMGSSWRRSAGVAVCIWVASILSIALLSAIDNDLDFYNRTMLGLLVLGVPVAIGCIVYAGYLLGGKALKWIGVSAVAIAIALGALAYVQHKRSSDLQWQSQIKGLDDKQVEKLNGVRQRNPDLASSLAMDMQGIRKAALHGAERPWGEIIEEMQEERRERLREVGVSEQSIDQVVPRSRSDSDGGSSAAPTEVSDHP